MDFTDYLLFKAIALVVLFGVVNFIYTLVTGRSIEEARRDKQPGRQTPREH